MTRKARSVSDVIRPEMPRLAQKFGVVSLSLFGSVVRGERRQCGDLDVMVEFSDPPGLFRFLELEDELCKLTGMKVDLIEKGYLKPAIAQCALREAVAI